MIEHDDHAYGPGSRNRLHEAGAAGIGGARAALETFYYALNNRDGGALESVWSEHPLAQLNNPVGGVVRGGADIGRLYRRIFEGPVVLSVTFADVVEYVGDAHVVFAGRETGSYAHDGGEPMALAIRTTRYFRHDGARWWQLHHHGSIDDPESLAAYQAALA